MHAKAVDIQSNTQHVFAQIHWSHFGAVTCAIILLLGAAWMKQPQLFALHKSNAATYEDVPEYYAYIEPEENHLPLVAGASTQEGPSVINEDGTISQVDFGEVLAASTEGVELSLNEIKVIVVPDSEGSIKTYLAQSDAIETGPIDTSEFAAALTSGNQESINGQVRQLIAIRDGMQKLSVPAGLIKLHKLKIIQYNAAIGLLQNFTEADKNPELVNGYLGQFLKSQQDLENESQIAAQRYSLD